MMNSGVPIMESNSAGWVIGSEDSGLSIDLVVTNNGIRVGGITKIVITAEPNDVVRADISVMAKLDGLLVDASVNREGRDDYICNEVSKLHQLISKSVDDLYRASGIKIDIGIDWIDIKAHNGFVIGCVPNINIKTLDE